MKALILNSGVGSRLKDFNINKCLAELANDVTILDLQIDALLRCGVDDIYITTGYRADELELYTRERFPHKKFTFINNPLYEQTNYIYSIYLARDFVRGNDILLLHGDLIFEQNVLQDLLASDRSVMAVDSTKPLPEKDFKAVVKDELVRSIGVEFFTDAIYAQPMYKLLRQDWDIWLDEIERFCSQSKTGVYAEDAFNTISHCLMLFPLDVTGRICFEVDNAEDLTSAQDAFLRMPDRLQTVYSGYDSRSQTRDILSDMMTEKPFVVHNMELQSAQELFGSNAVYFDRFVSNPEHSDVMAGIIAFEKEKCDLIVSFGGGSAIDTAKCINMLQSGYAVELRDVPRACHLCVPTTAGTGSESTRFAVLYIGGEKQSVEHERIMPDYVVLDPFFLATLPVYHKKSTLLDALCQAVESLWAKGRSTESSAHALSAIKIIYDNVEGYMENKPGYALRILQAANLAGKAINITKTTAAHAMSYKLTGMFGLAHGHAVALCLKYVWAHLLESDFHFDALLQVDYDRFVELCDMMDIAYDFATCGNDDKVISELVASVNIERLGNHPVYLSENTLADMYRGILGS